MTDFPQYTGENELGDEGVRIVNQIVSKQLGWILREQTKNDFGIDAFIEILTEERKATGVLMAVQIKCGNSFFSEEDEENYIFRGPKKHLNYWLNHSLPVIIIIARPDEETAWWVQVTRANAQFLDVNWKITIPKKQIFTTASKKELLAIANQVSNKDIIELLIPRFLAEKYSRRVYFHPYIETPHDFHGSTEMITLDGKTLYVDFYYPFLKTYEEKEIKKKLDLRDSNDLAGGRKGESTHLFLFFVADTVENLTIPQTIIALIASYEHVSYFRLIYVNKKVQQEFRSMYLTEIDEYGEDIWQYS